MIPECELPLFPLHTVLFPGTVIPLHISEGRYKALIQDCLGSNSAFGVCLIKGSEGAGDAAIPHQVGTVAQLARVRPLRDGAVYALATGHSRFQVLEVLRQRPYIQARAALLPEASGEPDAELVQKVRQALEAYLRLLAGAEGGWVRQPGLPDTPLALSFAVGSSIPGSLRAKQQLLEAGTVGERLKLGLPLLLRESHRLRRELEERRPYQASVN